MQPSNEELVVSTAAVARRPDFFELEPRQKIIAAKEMATALVEIVRERGLTKNFGGSKDHVEWEGWSILLTFLGVRADPKEIRRHANGTWEAVVELTRISDSHVVGTGSAICSVEERNWARAPDNSRRSMAITRAAGKAARLNFSWIMALGGLNPTPAEEMEGNGLDLTQVFDGSDGHRSYIREEINRRGIDILKLKTIMERMTDRPLSERDQVIDEVTKG